MIDQNKQAAKAERLRNLHLADEMLVLPNIWDPIGAILLQDLGHQAVATASAAVAYANGYDDGENIPFDDFLRLHRRISECVEVPVTADIESGFSASDVELTENIERLIDAGVVGINIEDTDKATGKIRDLQDQCDRIRIVREASEKTGVTLFINARTDVLLHCGEFPESQRVDEIIKRGQAYREAGSDGFFPILLNEIAAIKEVVSAVSIPVNILSLPGTPDLATLAAAGVKRVSLGPSVLKAALRGIKNVVLEIKEISRFTGVVENEITSDYLKNLVNNI